MLNGKNVVLGITGSISAYKAAFLTRLLIKEGANVKVMMTKSAIDFISPLTLSTLSKNEVLSDFTSNTEKGTWNNHVDLALWADIMLVAPATANTLSKMVDGLVDNFVLATYLSAKCTVYIAPAMDLDMYKHPSTQNNIAKLESFGNKVIYSETGELASGLEGQGRLAEPEHILEFITNDLQANLPLSGKHVLINAGPTYEDLDPVRFLGNRSTGKMGIVLAEKAYELGAKVVLVCGPTHLKVSHKAIKRIDVRSAQEMYEAMSAEYTHADITILAAAVADYTPKTYSEIKLKKQEGDLTIELKRTTDIAASLGNKKKQDQILVGFALETNNEEEHAKRKIEKKNLDFIVLNSLNDKGAGFSHATNKVKIIDKNNNLTKYELKSKEEVATDILTYLINQTSK